MKSWLGGGGIWMIQDYVESTVGDKNQTFGQSIKYLLNFPPSHITGLTGSFEYKSYLTILNVSKWDLCSGSKTKSRTQNLWFKNENHLILLISKHVSFGKV